MNIIHFIIRCYSHISGTSVSIGYKHEIIVAIVLFVCALTSSTPVNVALNKPIYANYTCGIFGMEAFNTLSDAYKPPSQLPRRTCSDIRLFNVTNRQLRVLKPTFPPEAMVDGNLSTNWQSVSRARAYTYGKEIILEISNELDVIINIDLLQEFLTEGIIIQFGDALTPQKISILRSMDGYIFTPWIYAVPNLDLCSQFFNATISSEPTLITDTICISYAADDIPPGDLVSVNLSQVPMTLKEWQRVRYMRIKLYDMLFVYPYNALAHNFNHYSISEITIMAECPCNGLQVGCEVNPTSGMYECICGGNTTGRFCESCLPLFNQFPFEFGKPCEACNCFGHATNCFYQASVEVEGLSMDTKGNKSGGGVCTDCQHNTAGINCEKCVSLYYRPAGILQTALDACIPCQCNGSGSTINPISSLMDCVMNSNQSSNDGKVPGDCFCKANVMGSKCAECKTGFYNLQQTNSDGCTSCACHTPGTVGSSEICAKDVTGQCSCKLNVQGRACDQCNDGFYGLANDNINGCLTCDCDVGGSLNQLCDKETGQCVCQSENILGRRCDTVRPNFFYLNPHGIDFELEDSFGQYSWKRDPQYAGFSGGGYAVVKARSSLVALLTVPVSTDLSSNYSLVIRYHSSEESTVTIQVLSADTAAPPMILPVCPSTWCEQNTSAINPVTLQAGPNLLNLTVDTGEVLLDKLVAIPEDFLQPRLVLPYSLPAGCDLLQKTVPSDPTDAVTCQKAIFSLTMFYLKAPLSCNCDMTGSIGAVCNVSGGQCACQPGVIGRTCNKCSPDHYSFGFSGCSACSCDEYGTICDSVTGQCQCPDNTMGIHCEFCAPNNWGWNKTQGCKPCECNPIGTASQHCNDTTGVCTCKVGVEGSKCDDCMDGFYNLSSQGCSPCLCNDAGSVESVCNKTTGQCICKVNTGGRQCDTCLLGTFGLDSKYSKGCLDCVCMGITKECVSAGIILISNLYQLSEKTPSGIVSTLKLASENGSSANVSVRFESNSDMTTAAIIDLTSTDLRLFWEMPDVLLASLLSLYGSDILFTVNYVIVDGQPLTDHKALLIDKAGSIMMYPLLNVTQGSDSSLVVTLREDGWRIVGNGSVPTREEYLKTLSTAKFLLLPAAFSTGKHTSRLSKLAFSSVSDVGPVNSVVEQCACGNGYTGRSCEMCAAGYRRDNVSGSDFLGVCVPCTCHGHSAICDVDTGICQNCQNNTEGEACENCLTGYHGNATTGTESDCTFCQCYLPRVVNTTCELDSNSTDIICPYCQEGYIGNQCDECDLLYYGSPQTVNGTCLPCACNGNANSCDSVTGICNSCSYNTTGSSCERCMVGFYGNASQQNCQECHCVPTATNNTDCDFITGQCSCVYGVGGRSCDQCLMAFWGYNVSDDFIGCKACGCVEAGSLSVQCDNSTGMCSCKANTAGKSCDTCVDGFFGLPTVSCQACMCDQVGSMNTTSCNLTSGQCECKPGIGGRRCDQCLPFFVNYTNTGCQECGSCQRSLGDNVENQTKIATELLNKTLAVLDVQMEDVRLQTLSSMLNESLDSLGLAGSSTDSVNDIIDNVTSTQITLLSNFENSKTKAASLVAAVQYVTSNGSLEVTRQLEMAQRSENLSKEVDEFEIIISVHVLSLTSYSNSASQYLNRTAVASNNTFTFENERSAIASLLLQAQNTSDIDTTNSEIYQQASDVASLNSTITTLSLDIDAATVSIANLKSFLDDQSISADSVGRTLAQATVFKSQAEDLKSAALSILNNTENWNTESLIGLNASRAAVKNTNAVYDGDAISVMTWAKSNFSTDVSNFVTGLSKLSNLTTLLPLLIDRVGTEVSQSEAHVTLLEKSFANLSSVYMNISPIGKDAEETIDNYVRVVTDLDTAISTIASANQLIAEVKGNISGDGFSKLEQEYASEKATSVTLRQQLMELDYGAQVLQSSINAASARLDSEAAQWVQTDVEMNAMRAIAQSLNSQVTGSLLNGQIANAVSLVEQAQSIAQTVNASTAIQDDVLKQKEAELNLLQERISQIQQLERNISQLLTNQTKYEAFQKNLTSAKSLSQTSVEKIKEVEDNVLLLQSKLSTAENLLEKLIQPVNFDGNLGLELKNPIANVPHLYDDLLIEMKRPANFTDGVVFFVDNPTTNAELEVGLLAGKIFFEFNTGLQMIRVTSLAEICDGCWVRIYASRYGTVGHLTVILMSTGGLVSNSERGSEDVNARAVILSSNLFVGSLPATQQTTKVANRTFQGCLYNVKYQDQLLNLWTSAIPNSQTSKCCQSPPDLTTAPTTQGVSFTGFGYLVLSPGSVQFSQTRQINLEFRTFSPDASLLKVISADNRTYTSLSLVAGYVAWETLSGGILSRLQSQNQYADGQWVQILAERNNTELKLSVKYLANGRSLSIINISLQFLDLSPLDNQNIIIGSVLDPLQAGYTVNNTNYAGCLRNFSIETSTMTTQINLTENVVASSGVVVNGCFENIISGLALTSDSAFAKLLLTEQVQQIRNLEFDIVTSEPHGIVAYISVPGALRFLYLALFGGNVIVVYRQNNTAVVVSSAQYVSDGRLHTVKLDCRTLRVSLSVDSYTVEETSQTLSVDYLAFSSGLEIQVGGVINGKELQSECPVMQSLIGGITRLSINTGPVSLIQSNILVEKDATLAGIPLLAGTTPASPVLTDPPLLPCASGTTPLLLDINEGFFMDGTNAISWSNFSTQYNISGYFQRSFAMDLEFSAFKADGVLLYVADLPENPSNYFTIYLMDGYIHLRMKTTIGREYDIQLINHYSNGQRYKVALMKLNDFCTLFVDTEKDYANTEANTNITSQLSIPASTSVYLGGVGHNVVSLSALPQPIQSQISKVNFAGAIYSVSLKSQDSSPPVITLPIGSLNRTEYPAVPKTAYYGVSLSGVNSYLGLGLVNTTENVTIEIKFTTVSDSGLFFLWDRGTSAPYLAMDMNKQQLHLYLYPSFNGVTEPLMLVLYKSASLCDGLPHAVKLEIKGSSAVITVDDKVGVPQFIPSSHAVQALYNADFYIGGYGGISQALPSNLTRTSLTGCILSVKLTTGNLGVVKTFDPTQFVSLSVGARYGCPY